ncbi:MAG: putative Zn-dependent protease [Cryomorphaceae bacterium]|jgi:predicted Zn-dependent protease
MNCETVQRKLQRTNYILNTTPPQGSTLQDAQRHLQSGNVKAAEQIVRSILESDPGNIEGLYTSAVISRINGSPEAALLYIEKVISADSNFARGFQEKGINCLSLNNPMMAIEALERAVVLDPSLLQSWQLLTRLYKKLGNEKHKETEKQVEFYQGLPDELVTVISYLANNQLADAERLCRYFLKSNKTHIEGMRLLAEIANRNNILDDAEFLLESAVEFAPEHVDANIQFAHILLRRQRFQRAYDQAKMIFNKFPDVRDKTRPVLASACFGVGKNDEAIEHFLDLVKSDPDSHLLPISLGHIYNAEGSTEKAVESFQTSYAKKKDHGDAYWSLANTKSYKFEDTEIKSMQSVESSDTISLIDQIQTCFALGKAFEDKKEFEQSFWYYGKGNELKLPETHHSSEQLQKRIDSQILVCDEKLFSDRVGLGNDGHDPIFVVGLPRSGSTLLEQILASHSKVDGTMELHNILDLAKRLRGKLDDSDIPQYPRILTELEDSYFKRFGDQFLEQTMVYRESAPMFIDKMPNNFFHIGLIKLILPNAKIIDARRHPMACCFSGFKQLFGEGQEFSYGLSEIGNYYKQYVKLMDHWDRVLPGFVLRVQHEDVVENLEQQVSRILDFCGLEFEQPCIDFHKTERSIRTPSAEQVRQPIYRTGLEQWKNYESWLGPLKEALGSEIRNDYGIE